MPFGIIGPTCPGMRQIVGFGDKSTGRGTFGDEFGAHHCPQGPVWRIRLLQRRDATFSQITLGRLVIVLPKKQIKFGQRGLCFRALLLIVAL